MLICNNCSHINEDGVVQCGHCHMRGNFTYSMTGERRSDDLRKDPEEEHCLNCGSHSPGEGDRCGQCNFPRTTRSPAVKRAPHVFAEPREKVDR